MLYQADRHEPLRAEDGERWDEDRARTCIAAIVRNAEARFSPGQGWPTHPLDLEPGEDPEAGNPSLHFGTCGVLWALHFLRAKGPATLERDWPVDAASLVQRTREWLKDDAERERAAYLMGETPVWLLEHATSGSAVAADRLADFPGTELDDLLLAAGETTWAAGPLKKGSNLCHGTGGNGYAFLKLFKRAGDARWLQRARALAMHGIRQTEAHAAQYGRMRYSLWTGDPGFAVYLWDCIRGEAEFPTLDVF